MASKRSDCGDDEAGRDEADAVRLHVADVLEEPSRPHSILAGFRRVYGKALAGKVVGVLTTKVVLSGGDGPVELPPIVAVSGHTKPRTLDGFSLPAVLACFEADRSTTAGLLSDERAPPAALDLFASRTVQLLAKLAMFYRKAKDDDVEDPEAALRAALEKFPEVAGKLSRVEAHQEQISGCEGEALLDTLVALAVKFYNDEQTYRDDGSLKRTIADHKQAVEDKQEAAECARIARGERRKVEGLAGKATQVDTTEEKVALLKATEEEKDARKTATELEEATLRKQVSYIKDEAAKKAKEAASNILLPILRNDLDTMRQKLRDADVRIDNIEQHFRQYDVSGGLDFVADCETRSERSNFTSDLRRRFGRELEDVNDSTRPAHLEAKAHLYVGHVVATELLQQRISAANVDSICTSVREVLAPTRFKKNTLISAAQCAEDNAVAELKMQLLELTRTTDSRRRLVTSAECLWTCTKMSKPSLTAMAVEPLCQVCEAVFEDKVRYAVEAFMM